MSDQVGFLLSRGAYLPTGRALGAGGGNYISIDLQLNIDGSINTLPSLLSVLAEASLYQSTWI
jgi:hypothetical protein